MKNYAKLLLIFNDVAKKMSRKIVNRDANFGDLSIIMTIFKVTIFVKKIEYFET